MTTTLDLELIRGELAAPPANESPCVHSVASHVHGTNAAYCLDACRCHPCTAAHTRYANALVRQRAYGRPEPLVGSATAADHLEALRKSGMSLRRIAMASRVSTFTLLRLGERTSSRCRREVAEAILAVRSDPLHVNPTGTLRRLRALAALGWPMAELGRRLGLPQVPDGRWAAVDAHAASLVRDLYAELSMTVPPPGRRYTSARGLAARKGWVPPLAWDDDEIDDPAAVPAGVRPRA